MADYISLWESIGIWDYIHLWEYISIWDHITLWEYISIWDHNEGERSRFIISSHKLL